MNGGFKMKKSLLTILSATLVAGCLFGCSSTTTTEDTTDTTEETTVGGWTINDDDTSYALPEEVKTAFDKACEGYTGMGFTPVAYLGSQVVSGTNYKILCKGTTVTENPETKYVTVTVYADLDGNAEITDVVDFNIEDYTEESTSEGTESGLAGGWTVADVYNVVNMEADVQQAFDKAMEGMLGVTYEPVAYLGSQVVSGTNYAILCHTTTVTENPENGFAVVIIYADLDGNASVSNVTQLDLANL